MKKEVGRAEGCPQCPAAARIDTPSAPLSIFKAFLLYHKIPAQIICWNLLFDKVFSVLDQNTDVIEFDLLPYIYVIAGRHDDAIARARANAYMKS